MDELSSGAQEQRVALTAKQAEVDEAMEAIEAAMEAASSRKAEVERLSTQQEQARHVAVQRKVCFVFYCTRCMQNIHRLNVLWQPNKWSLVVRVLLDRLSGTAFLCAGSGGGRVSRGAATDG